MLRLLKKPTVRAIEVRADITVHDTVGVAYRLVRYTVYGTAYLVGTDDMDVTHLRY
jgi:hypothetical protein